MTDREKAIVMAYTGVCMMTGDKFQIFHKYIEDIMGRPIMTLEIGGLENEIKKKSKADFIALCANEEQEPCEDCVSRKDAIIQLSHNKTGNDDCDVIVQSDIETIKALPPVTPKQTGWIPVSERLPEEWESVLVCFKTQGGMAQAVSERFDGDRWSALCGMKPIAWMPLPEPYKAESEDKE